MAVLKKKQIFATPKKNKKQKTKCQVPPRHAGTGLGKHLSPFDQEILVLDQDVWKCLTHKIKMNDEHCKYGLCLVTQSSDIN